MTVKPTSPLQVGEWRYLPEQDKLVKADEQGDFTITADLDNLCQKVANYFIVNAGRLITKDELLLEVWGIRDVSDGRVTRVIRVLRVALGDDTREPTYIETIPKRGYRFIAPVTELPEESDADDSEMTSGSFSHVVQKRAATRNWLVALVVVAFSIVAALWWFGSSPANEEKIVTIPMMRYQPVTSLDGLEFYPHVSSDEKYLIFSHASPEAEHVTVLMLQDLHGHKKIQLTDPSYSSFGAAFSPDTAKIAYHRMYLDGKCEIRLLNFDPDTMTATDDQKLVSCGDNSISARITWSPDGKFIVYPSYEEESKQTVLMLLAIDGGTPEKLTLPPANSFGDYSARFSRNGGKLAFLRDAAGAAQIWLLDLNNRSTRMLVQLDGTYPGMIDWDVTGSKIIYPSGPTLLSAIDITTGKNQVFAYTDKHTQEVQVSPSGQVYASVGIFSHININKVANAIFNPSPTTEVVFSSNRNEILVEANPKPNGPVAVVSKRSGLSQLWFYWLTGEQKQITFFPSNERFRDLVFSPDGNQVLTQINNSLWILSEEKEPVKIAESGDNVIAFPTWSHDGKKVYYAEAKRGRWQITSIDPDTLVEPELMFEGRDLYIEDYNGNYAIWRDSLSRKFYLETLSEGRVEELPIFLPENQIYLKAKFGNRGLYFTSLIEESSYNLMYVDFITREVSLATHSVPLHHRRFAITPDEKHFYILNGVRGDLDIARLPVIN